MISNYRNDLSVSLTQSATIQVSGDELTKLITMLKMARTAGSLSEEQRKTADILYKELTINS